MIMITFRGGNMLSPVYLFVKLGLNTMKASRRIPSLLQMQKATLKAFQLLPGTRTNPSVIRLSNKQMGATIGAICASSALDGISLITPYTSHQTLLPFKLSVPRIKILMCNDYITEVGKYIGRTSRKPTAPPQAIQLIYTFQNYGENVRTKTQVNRPST